MGLIGQRAARSVEIERLHERLRRLPEWSRDALFASPQGLMMLYAGDLTSVADLFVKAPLNTDDRPLIEFLAPQLTRVRRPPAAPAPQALQRPALSLPAPGGRVGRVQAFAPEHRPDAPDLPLAIHLPEDAQLVLRGEPPPRGLRGDLGIRDRQAGGVAPPIVLPPAARDLAVLAHASSSFLALTYTNFRGVGV